MGMVQAGLSTDNFLSGWKREITVEHDLNECDTVFGLAFEQLSLTSIGVISLSKVHLDGTIL